MADHTDCKKQEALLLERLALFSERLEFLEREKLLRELDDLIISSNILESDKYRYYQSLTMRTLLGELVAEMRAFNISINYYELIRCYGQYDEVMNFFLYRSPSALNSEDCFTVSTEINDFSHRSDQFGNILNQNIRRMKVIVSLLGLPVTDFRRLKVERSERVAKILGSIDALIIEDSREVAEQRMQAQINWQQ